MLFANRIKLGLAVMALFATATLPAFAGNEGSGGGNAVVARTFVYQAFVLSQEFKALPKTVLPDWFSAKTFETAVQHVKTYGVDELEPALGSEGVYLNARFFPQEMTIRVKWKDLENLSRDEIRSLAMHEYLGVLYMEQDGRYDRSSQMLAILADAIPPSNPVGNPINWTDPPIVCGENQDFDPSYADGRRSDWSKIHLKEGGSAEDSLALAFYKDDIATIEARLTTGLNPNFAIEDCGTSEDTETGTVTIMHGCGHHRSLLQEAAEGRGSAAMVQLLLNAGADPNPIDKLKNSPLVRALSSEWAEFEKIRVLVDHGARYKDDKGAIEIEVLSRVIPLDQGDPETICPMMSKVKFFQKLGLDINDARLPSAVQLAFNMNVPMLKLFKQLGARFDLALPDLPDLYAGGRYRGMTVLHALAAIDRSSRYGYNKAQAARYLVQGGAVPAAKNTEGLTALDWSWGYFTQNQCGTDEKALDWHCMAERALIEYLVDVTPKK